MEDIVNIFRNLVSEKVLEKIENDFELIIDTNILELGVDSLAVMEIVIRIEEMYKVEIDYSTFEIEYIETPRKILDFIAKLKNN